MHLAPVLSARCFGELMLHLPECLNDASFLQPKKRFNMRFPKHHAERAGAKCMGGTCVNTDRDEINGARLLDITYTLYLIHKTDDGCREDIGNFLFVVNFVLKLSVVNRWDKSRESNIERHTLNVLFLSVV
jgi:hypothetical protein